MDHLKIRDAALDDATVIAEIYNESIAAGDSTMIDEAKTAESICRQMSAFGSRECFLLLERDGGVVGWAVIKRYSNRSGYRYACETSTFLRRSEVRKGLGTHLARAVIERCKVYAYHHLVARVFADNAASIEFHKHVGYELVGIQREIGFKNGHRKDVAVMQLVLDDESQSVPGDVS